MENLLIIGLAAFCTVIPLALGRRHGLLPLVSPMHLLAGFAGLGFLVKAVAVSFVPDLAFYARFDPAPGAAATGALYLTGFILMICLGYRCAVGATRRHPVREAIRASAGQLRHRNLLIALSFVISALTFALILQARGGPAPSWETLATLNRAKQVEVDARGIGATLAGIKTLFILPKCAFVLILAQGLARKSGAILFQAALLAALLIGVAVVSGDRFELIELVIYGVATYVIVCGHVRWKALLTCAAALALVIAVSAQMTVLRGQGAGLWEQVVGSTYFLDFNAAVMITDRAPPLGMLSGESYLWWIFGWVPRAMWEAKPAIDLGVMFKQEIMGVTTGGAFNVTGPGEAFINFGWAGMLVGFALGWVYRRLEVALLATPGAVGRARYPLYPLLFAPFLQATLQSSFSAFIVGAVAQWVLIALVMAFCLPRPVMRGRSAKGLQRRFAYAG